MKIWLVIGFIFLVGSFFVYRIFWPRTWLVAVGGLDGKLSFWVKVDDETKKLVGEAFLLSRSRLAETLENRKKNRNGVFALELPVSVYVVEDKKSFYFIADYYPYKAPGLEVVTRGQLENSVQVNKASKAVNLNIHLL